MMRFQSSFITVKPPNAGLQLRRAISIRAEVKRLLENHAVAPSAARLCSAAELEPHSTATIQTLP